MTNMTLSKSKFLMYKSCPKQLWLHINKPEEEVEDPSAEKHIEDGKQVGELAKQFFKGSIDVTSYKEDGSLDYENMIGLTNRYLLDRETIIAEATFSIDDLFCSVDILKPVENGYEIYEVKGTTEVKAKHQIDVAFQKYVLEKRGLKIVGVYVIHLNNNYVRHGELDLEQLFVIENINNKKTYKSSLKTIEEDIQGAKAILALKDEQDTIFCSKCRKCPFFEYCTKDLPKPSVFDIWKQSDAYELANSGIVSFNDIRANGVVIEHNRRKVQLKAYFEDKDAIIDKDGLKAFINKLKYPIYHLDFESVMFAIPPCDGIRPHEQVPTQYSLHIEYEDGRLEHKEFLGDSLNPKRAIAESLVKNIPGDSTVLAFNDSFEGGRLEKLANEFEEFRDALLKINSRLVDLWEPFGSGYYYDSKMGGSNSIKQVLPALYPNDPELDYHALPVVHNGGEAMDIYPKMLEANPEEKQKIRDGLLKYCCLDTLAMVKILKKIKDAAK